MMAIFGKPIEFVFFFVKPEPPTLSVGRSSATAEPKSSLRSTCPSQSGGLLREGLDCAGHEEARYPGLVFPDNGRTQVGTASKFVGLLRDPALVSSLTSVGETRGLSLGREGQTPSV